MEQPGEETAEQGTPVLGTFHRNLEETHDSCCGENALESLNSGQSGELTAEERDICCAEDAPEPHDTEECCPDDAPDSCDSGGQPKNIVLIGLMGVGKTTTGIQVAKRLKRPFIDTDDHIEASAGMSIAEIFEREGESGFREREHQVVAEVASQYGQVIAVGGGTATFERNTELLRATGDVIWLNTEPDVLLTRLGSRVARAHRPLISEARSATELLDTLSELQTEREDSYRKAAHHEIYISKKESRSAVIYQILKLTGNR